MQNNKLLPEKIISLSEKGIEPNHAKVFHFVRHDA